MESHSALRYVVRSNNGTTLYQTPDKLLHNFGECKLMKFSYNGHLLALVNSDLLSVYNVDNLSLSFEIPMPGLQAIEFSPSDSCILTWQRPGKEQNIKNMCIYSSKDGQFVTSLFQKAFTEVAWPYIQWSDDEILGAHMVKNQVNLYDGQNMNTGISSKLVVQNIAQFSLAPGPAPYKIATFVPEKKGAPAFVRIFEYPKLSDNEIMQQKSFYRAQHVEFMWNADGTALLILTHTDVDMEGKSYYGETKLYFMRPDGKMDCQVPLQKEGIIHSVKWSPSGRDFAVTHGYTPSKTLIFNTMCDPIFDLGNSARNTLVWAPHGRFLCLGGFGSQAGDMDFWDRNKLKRMGGANADCSVSQQWSPDSRYLMTAVTAPRMRVDNGLTIFNYCGMKITEMSFETAYEVAWVPDKTFPDRPASPETIAKAGKMEQDKKQNAGVYRPPGARNDPNWRPDMMFRRDDDAPGIAKRLDQIKAQDRPWNKKYIPGAEQVAPQQSKSARKREKQKAKAQAGVASQLAQSELQHGKDEVPESSPLTLEESQKRLKNVTKKLKQIAALEKRVADGEKLDPDQIKKINNLQNFTDEKQSLEARIAELSIS